MDLFRKLQAANITVDTFDIRGLMAVDGGTIDDMRALAENTGGRAVVNTNAPEAPVPDIFRENSSYYLLGIESDAKPGDEQLHKIQVKTSRPDVTIRTRSGYFAPALEKPKKKKDAEPPSPHAALDATLDTTLPVGGIPLDLSVAPFAAASGKGATLLVFTGLQEPASQKEPLSGEVELVERAYDIEGQPQSTYRQNITVPAGFDSPLRDDRAAERQGRRSATRSASPRQEPGGEAASSRISRCPTSSAPRFRCPAWCWERQVEATG